RSRDVEFDGGADTLSLKMVSGGASEDSQFGVSLLDRGGTSGGQDGSLLENSSYTSSPRKRGSRILQDRGPLDSYRPPHDHVTSSLLTLALLLIGLTAIPAHSQEVRISDLTIQETAVP